MNNIKVSKLVGSEVCAVLNNIPEEQYNKLPKSLRETFMDYGEESEKIKINLNIPFSEQNISKQAKDIIFAISYKYWLNEKERQEVNKKLKINEEQLKEKYSYENLFKNSKKELESSSEPEQNVENILPIEAKKENTFAKLWSFLKTFFKKK